MFGQDDAAAFCRANCERSYNRLYNIEAYLRFMLRWELVAAYAEHWQDQLGQVFDQAMERLEQERALRIIDADEENIMSYMMLGDLKDVMFKEGVWSLFKQQWPPQDLLQADFKLLIAVRNKNAHYRPVTARDMRTIERLQTTISEMTNHYRRERANAFPKTPEKLPDALKEPVLEWIAAIDNGASPWASVAATKLDKYYRLDAALKSGALPDDTVHRIVKAGRANCLFAGFDATSGRLSLYLPKGIGTAHARRLIREAMALTPSEMELDLSYHEELPRLDYVFEAAVQLPAPFRI